MSSTVAVASEGEVERIDRSTIRFRNGPPLTIPLHDIEVLGSLRTSDPRRPRLLVSGKTCSLCAEDRSIFIVSPDGSQVQQFVYPGRIINVKGGGAAFEARAFFGKCLPGREDVYVVYQTDVVDKKKRGRRFRSIEPSVFVAEPTDGNGISEELKELKSPAQLATRLRSTLALTKQKECREINGRSRAMASKLPDIRIRRDAPEDDLEDEDAKDPAPAANPRAPASVE